MGVAFVQSQNWDDYRVLLAVARCGSFQAAGQSLGVATSTVARRLSAWEERLGLGLVLRSAGGVLLTDEGQRMRALAEQLEQRITLEARDAARDDDGRLSGRIRVTAGDGFTELVVDIALAFRTLHPGVEVEVDIDARASDMGRREADVALRTMRPKGDLIARRAGVIPFGLFAAPTYLARRGTPRTLAELGGHDLVTFCGLLERVNEARWLAGLARTQPTLRVTTVSALVHALERGAGVGVVATMLARPGALVRILPRAAPEPTPAWIALHRDARKVERVAAFADFLAARVADALRSRSAVAG